jgi:hypothetical protein
VIQDAAGFLKVKIEVEPRQIGSLLNLNLGISLSYLAASSGYFLAY